MATRLGIVLSVLWIALISFVYFNELINYPSCCASPLPHDTFEWAEDTEDTEVEGRLYGFIPIKPTFSFKGYSILIVLPLLLTWLVCLRLSGLFVG